MFGAALDNTRSALAPARPWGRRAAAVAPHAAFGLLLLAILAYAGYFAYYTLSSLDLVGMVRDVNTDDSFYYFQVARNLAEGMFSTFDGGITRTNGYHPLWLLLITPFYWVLDRETALFGIKALELCLIGGSVALLAVSARLCRLPWVALFAVLPLLYQHRWLWWGLEAAAGLFALSLLFLSLSLAARNATRWWPLLAAVAFILPWARLEYLAISLAATAGAAIVVWTQNEPAAGAARRGGPGLELGRFRINLPAWRVYAPFLAAVLGGMIYFAYNRLVFGGYVPVSGAVKQAWSWAYFEDYGGYALAENVRAHLQFSVFSDGLLAAAEVGAYALLVWWVSRRASPFPNQLPSPNQLLPPLFMIGAAALALGHAAKFAQHALSIHPHFNADWYFVPAYLLMALLIPIRCFTAVYLINTLVRPRWPNIGRLLTGATVAATVITLVVTVGFTQSFKDVDNMSSNTARDWEVSSYLGTQIMNRILPDGAVVGSWDAGVVGYFADFPVVNLDGLVNGYDHYHQYILTKSYYSSKVFQEYGITHYANAWDDDQEKTANALFEGVVFFEADLQQAQNEQDGKDAGGIDFSNLIYDPVARKFMIWQSDRNAVVADTAGARLRALLQEQGDYYDDGAAALVHSNLVHTFDFDCNPQQPRAYMLTVAGAIPTVAENRSDDNLLYLPVGGNRNYLGYCIDAFELPNATAHPVDVTMQPLAPAVNELLQGNPPLVQSEWEVYRIGRQLLYQRAPCTATDTAARFYLHFIPARVNDLAVWQRQWAEYASRDFEFDTAGGVRHAGRCVVTALLPDYAIAGIRTGQYIPEMGSLWDGEFYTETYRAARAAELAAQAVGEPARRDFYSVYYDADAADALTYIREDCAPADTAAQFYLHIIPADTNELPAAQREHGFDNRDFDFGQQGGIWHDGRCMVSVPLPDYELHGIRTGQYTADAVHQWGGEFYTAAYYAALADELATLAGRRPAAQNFYSVYYNDGTLTYIREDCTPADTAAAFYLHLVPADAAVLPAGQREHGFDNRDFEFGAAGGVQSAGRCLVSVELPDYAVAGIRTGQYTPDAERLWAAEFAVGAQLPAP